MTKRYRKPTLLTLLFLLAGAVVNVAVAWLIAAFQPGEPILTPAWSIATAIPSGISADEWSPNLRELLASPRHPGPTWLLANLTLDQLPRDSFRSEVLSREVEGGRCRIAEWYSGTFDGANATTIMLWIHQEHVGWPRRAMVSTHAELAAWDNAGDVVDPVAIAPAELARWVEAHNSGLGRWRQGAAWFGDRPLLLGRRPPRFPLMPLWPGFAWNALLYAALVAGLTLGPFALRRGGRRKRGACVACGYSLQGNPTGGVCPRVRGESRMTSDSSSAPAPLPAPSMSGASSACSRSMSPPSDTPRLPDSITGRLGWFAVVAAVALSAALGLGAVRCAAQPHFSEGRFERIVPGMTEAEVLATLGEPRHGDVGTPGRKSWVYHPRFEFIPDPLYTVEFEDGIVTDAYIERF